mgnify:CR=1 FL=1
MKPRRSDLPLTLTAELAAEYVGCRSAAQFRREVKAGLWPQPCFARSRPQRWSRTQLDGKLTGGDRPEHNSPLDNLERMLGLSDDAESPLPQFGRRQVGRS